MNDDRKILANLIRHELSSVDDPLTPLIDSYFIKRKKHPHKRLKWVKIPVREAVRPGGRLSPSSIGGCKRQAALRFLGVEGQIKVNPDTEAIFEHGHWVHHKWQTIFKDMQKVLGRKRFRCLSIEEKIQIPDLYVGGALDARIEVKIKGRWETIIVDVKSINERGWGRVMDAQAPLEEHVEQLTTYGKAKDAKYGILLYENKNTQHFQPFIFEFDEEVWAKVERWAEDVIEDMEAKRLPDMHEECEHGTFLYEKCPYRGLCFGTSSIVQIRKRAYKDFAGLEPLWEQGLREAG